MFIFYGTVIVNIVDIIYTLIIIQERMRSENMKYWSMIGSLIGATIGFLGTSFNNYIRMNNIKYIVKISVSYYIRVVFVHNYMLLY